MGRGAASPWEISEVALRDDGVWLAVWAAVVERRSGSL